MKYPSKNLKESNLLFLKYSYFLVFEGKKLLLASKRVFDYYLDNLDYAKTLFKRIKYI